MAILLSPTETIVRLTIAQSIFFFFENIFPHVAVVKEMLALLQCFVFAPGLGNFVFYAGVQAKLAQITHFSKLMILKYHLHRYFEWI